MIVTVKEVKTRYEVRLKEKDAGTSCNKSDMSIEFLPSWLPHMDCHDKTNEQ